LSFVQLQTELGKACPEFSQTSLSLALAFKADHEVIRVANHDDVAAASVLHATT
jgi:hypothetical protein